MERDLDREAGARKDGAMFIRKLAVTSVLLAAIGCGSSPEPGPAPPPLGAPITRTEGTVIASATEWRWIPFDDAFCTDATLVSGAYQFGTSTTGLAINWGSASSADVVVFLQGGGACWDFFTCGGARQLDPRLDKIASTGPFGPTEFANGIYSAYPSSWIRRANLPGALADATIVFVPYCTGDVHAGDKVTTYAAPPLSGLPAITWHHVGHANMKAFLKRLGATFTNPAKVVLAGSSAGGFGSLANYEDFRAYWPQAKSYLIDDSGPPLAGNTIPSSTRDAWYASWNMGASLDAFCPGCRTDMSQGLREIAARHPQDRVALISHLQDLVIRGFFGTYTLTPPSLTPMSGSAFETALRDLGTNVMNPTARQRYFFTAGTGHPTLEDPTAITTPSPGLAGWLELMLSDSTSWASASD